MRSDWDAPIECSAQEEKLLKLCKKQKLWHFMRTYRHVLLDEEIRAVLAGMYASGGAKAGKPISPERLALAMLLQVAFDVADHEVPTLTAVDQRWQMVLDCAGSSDVAFSQGTVFNFRERARANGLMDRLLDKTVTLARESKGFSHKRLRVMIDSSPLTGAGRVEDTFNLIGRALQRLVRVAAAKAGEDATELAKELDLPVVGASSVKVALDLDWRESTARTEALNALLTQFESVMVWLRSQFSADELESPPIGEAIALVEEFIEQDTEPDPDDPESGARTIVQGTAKGRRISISDPDMTHGHKSTTKKINGYKDHYTLDADIPGLIVESEVLPSNRPENEGAGPMLARLDERGFEIIELHVDRGYLGTAFRLQAEGVDVITKAPKSSRKDGFGKYDFIVDSAAEKITCPSGESIPHRGDGKEHCFPAAVCRECPLYRPCVAPKNKFGKRLGLHPFETFLRQTNDELGTVDGRARRRERARVEHGMARIAGIRGRRARFRGLQKVSFDSKRNAVVANLYVLAEVLPMVA